MNDPRTPADAARELQESIAGTTPEGKLNAEDEGALAIAVSVEGVCVRVDFGEPTVWLALDPGLAERLADTLRHHAGVVRQRMLLAAAKPATSA